MGKGTKGLERRAEWAAIILGYNNSVEFDEEDYREDFLLSFQSNFSLTEQEALERLEMIERTYAELIEKAILYIASCIHFPRAA